MHFADQIIKACQDKQSRLVVGLDPHWHLIPDSFKAQFPKDDIQSTISAFLAEVIDHTCAFAVAYKPQIAFFEQFGLAGFHALTTILDKLKGQGKLVIMDAKRNDIGSTASAYARTFFGGEDWQAPFPSNALTINAYLGEDGVRPFTKDQDHGVFILVKTSNPSSGTFQDRSMASGESLATAVARSVHQWNSKTIGELGYGTIGAVVGATYPDHMAQLRREMPQSLILVPGYGAQGGDAKAVQAAFNADGFGALINSSRGILFPNPGQPVNFADNAEAAQKARDHINSLIKR